MGAAEFNWTRARTQAAFLLATTSLTLPVIGEQIGVAGSTISTWKKHPAFMERVAEIENEELEEVKRLPFARKSGRIRNYNDLLEGMNTVIRSRSEGFQGDPAARKEGAETGLVIKRRKALGSGGPYMEIVDEYEVDTALLKTIESMSTQIAKELGQWQEKSEVSGPGSGSINIQFGSMSSEESALDEEGEL